MDNAHVLALAYRPNKLTDLIGQDAAAITITNAWKDKKLYQCLLFSGNFGCGKTSAARILAAMDNCEKGPTLEPCGKCEMCQEIFSGQSSDVREINAASDTGIDAIRNLIDFVSSRPNVARVKYVILDEVHALSRQAVEAALKLFEEPPEGVRFILCTTDLHKMKGTIQSRCMPFRFVKVQWQQIAQHLTNIANKEKVNVEEGAIKLAARLSDGSVRNSLRNLQLLINFSGGQKITTDLAQKALGALDDSNWFNLIDCVVANPPNAAAGYKIVQDILSNGQEANQIIEGLSEHLRNLLVLTSVQSTAGILYLSEDEKKRYIHQMGKLPIHVMNGLVVEMISLLYEVARNLTFNLNPQMLFEAYVIKSIKANADLQRAAKQTQTG